MDTGPIIIILANDQNAATTKQHPIHRQDYYYYYTSQSGHYRWVLWKSDPIYAAGEPKVDGEGKPRFGKVPYNAKNDQRANTTDPSTWASFDEVVARFYEGDFDGLGFVLGYEETGRNFAGVDIDHLETSEDWQRARQVADYTINEL